ncbi:MAG: hypothetical protein NT007_07565 [Candidatus Kapabacteria bacterium]|nr:hypothetical protein [Candidatus Kapabacteria bacterium]
MKKNNLKYLLVIFICLSTNLFAEKTFEFEKYALRANFGGLYNYYSSSFAKFQGCKECKIFENGGGFGYSALLGYETLIAEKMHFGIDLAYINRSGNLSVDISEPSRIPINYNFADSRFRNSLDITLNYFELTPQIRYILTEWKQGYPFRFMAGLRFGLPVTHSFVQNYSIIQPDNAYFIDTIKNIKTRNAVIASGDIRSIAIPAIGLSMGFENLLKIGTSTYFTQQLIFDYNFNNVAIDVDWSEYAIRLELGIRFGLEQRPEPEIIPVLAPPPPIIVKIDPIPPKPKPYVNINKSIYQGTLQTGNELLATVPLVNAVFFDAGKSEIPPFYIKNKNDFTNFFSGNPVELHKYLFTRLALIAQNNPKAQFTLIGASSGKYEDGSIILSQERANAVKEVLTSLGVPKDKIITKALLTPSNPSSSEFKESIYENQRVDIIVKNAPLQEFVDLQRYAELDGNLIVDVDFGNIKNSSELTINSSISSKPITSSVKGTFSLPVKFRLTNENINLPYRVDLGNSSIETKLLDSIDISKLTKKVFELNLTNFDAILRFDYNSSVLSDDNKELLSQLSKKLPLGATLLLTGSSDALGAESRNIILAKERAANTKQYIESIAKGKFKFEMLQEQQKADESTPQGRFLNRSIKIKVKN